VKKIIASLALSLSLLGNAHADVITYTETATASGSLGGTAFTGQLITLTLTTDTSLITGSALSVTPASPSTVAVNGFATANFTDNIIVFDNNGGVAGFEDNSLPADILDISNNFFTTYNLRTSAGPITGNTSINSGSSFGTDAGNLIINSVSAQGTFTATTAAVPEPASVALFGLGVAAGVVGRRRLMRRRLA
jgi:hypothetical protein